MRTNVKSCAASLFVMSMGFLVSACVGQTESTAAPNSIGEVQQESQSCSSDCSGVENGIPFSMTCTNTCTATPTGITCDMTYNACQQNCSPLNGGSCGTLRCTCMTIPKHYDCDGICVPDEECSCCGRLPC